MKSRFLYKKHNYFSVLNHLDIGAPQCKSCLFVSCSANFSTQHGSCFCTFPKGIWNTSHSKIFSQILHRHRIKTFMKSTSECHSKLEFLHVNSRHADLFNVTREHLSDVAHKWQHPWGRGKVYLYYTVLQYMRLHLWGFTPCTLAKETSCCYGQQVFVDLCWHAPESTGGQKLEISTKK